ncbi:MAG TPA: hypothetical protein VMK84_03345, partial [Streptosporangiaceae bacterium]|nr:hypothetical protein [Streptosporangiaceae bacterium]
PAATGDTGPITRVQGHRAPAHRAPRTPRDQRWLRAVPGLVPLAALLRGTWHAHHAAVVAAGAATVAAPVLVGAALTVAVPASAAHQGRQAVVPAPAASVYRAVPVTSPSPSARPKADAAKARPAAAVTVPADGPPSFPPSTVPSPSPSVSSPPAPLLSVPAGPVAFGVYVRQDVTIGNPQDQAVSWSVDCGANVAAIPSMGVLEPGQQGVQVQLSLDPVDGASAASCLFEPGNERLAVVWDGAGSPSAGI